MGVARRKDPNRCPECGERVGPMAAGCAQCGATLDPRRFQRANGPGPLRRFGQTISTRLQYGGGGGGGGRGRPRNLAPDWKERPLRALFILAGVLFAISLAFSVLSYVIYSVL